MIPRALVRPPSRSLVTGATLTHVPRVPLIWEQLVHQHERYVHALRRVGYEVAWLDPLQGHPDGVFLEDLGLVLPEVVVWGRSAALGRRSELRETLRNCPDLRLGRFPGEGSRVSRQVLFIEPPGTLDGGDVLRLGRTVLVGISSRTNGEAADQLERAVGPHGYEVRRVPVTGALHLKTGCTSPGRDLLAVNPYWVDAKALTGFRWITVAPGEPFGANLLPGPGGVLVSASAPETAAAVAREGFEVVSVEISEFEKGEGGLTCLSLRNSAPS